MERLSDAIANKVALELNLDGDSREVIAYGTFAILDMLLSITLVAIFGALFNVMAEALIMSFTSSMLRKYSGGAHASSPAACTTIGTAFCVGQALLMTFLLSSFFNINLYIVFGILIFIWSYVMVYKLAPVDSPAKPIRRKEKRDRMKKGSILVLTAYLVIVAVNIITYFYTGERRLVSFSACICGGTAWQVFTLTEKGRLVLGKVDTFFNQILKFIRRH